MIGDEVGTCTIQEDDRNEGVYKFITTKGVQVSTKISHEHGRLSAVGFTFVSREPVMEVVIFATEELDFE